MDTIRKARDAWKSEKSWTFKRHFFFFQPKEVYILLMAAKVMVVIFQKWFLEPVFILIQTLSILSNINQTKIGSKKEGRE